MLIRVLIKSLTSTQVKQVIENCNRASVVVSPSTNGQWSVSACLKDSEVESLRHLGYAPIKVPG
jgi:hypothetical protein